MEIELFEKDFPTLELSRPLSVVFTENGLNVVRKGAPGVALDVLAQGLTEYRVLTEEEAEALTSPTEEQITARLAAEVRAERDRRISETDYLMMADYPIEGELRQEWAVYRQLLRDITEQPGFPDAVEWPVKPEEI